MKFFTAKLLSLFLAFSVALSPVLAAAPESLPEASASPLIAEEDQAWLAMAEAAESFTVQLQAPSLLMRQSQLPEHAQRITADPSELQLDSPQAIAYLQTLNQGIDSFLLEAVRLIGRPLDVLYRYDYVLNGFSARMSLKEAAILHQHPSVKGVYPDKTLMASTNTDANFLGADQIWDGTAVPLPAGKRGEGVRIAFVDTGINVSHPSFAGTTPGYTYPAPVGGYLGLCKTHPTTNTCNNKLIGYYDMLHNINGHDQGDHGSHVAGIAAGNPVQMTYEGIAVDLTGIAPRAQILSYKACDINGCPEAAVIAGINLAIADKANVINIGSTTQPGPARDPWQDPTDLALLEALKAGVIVSTAAGDWGPKPESNYRAAPWALVTGSSTHGRIFGYDLWLAGKDLTFGALAVPAAKDLAPLVTTELQGDMLKDPVNNLYGCNDWPAGSGNYKIGLVKRGVCDFKVKLEKFKAAGGLFLLVYNDRPGSPTEMGTLTGFVNFPAGMITQELGEMLMNYAYPKAQITVYKDRVSGTEPGWGDVLAESSGRGPIPQFDLLKPDLVAPGQSILAANAAPNAIGLMSRSTMAAAQTAGAAALMKSLYPSWSPTAIQSALVMTAKNVITKDTEGNPANTPFDYGNGRLDLTKAALAGLVMEESYDRFLHANPSIGGDPRTLNIPSYQNRTCLGSCSFTRTFKNVTNQATTYTISFEKSSAMQISSSPQGSFTIPAGGTQDITFTLRPALGMGDAWQFARVNLKTTNGFPNGKRISDLSFSAAAKTLTSGSNLPRSLRLSTPFSSNRWSLKDAQFTSPISGLNSTRYGFYPAKTYAFTLAEDPSSWDDFDDLKQVWYTTTQCPANQERMVVEVLDTDATDIDLLVGTGQTPSKATVQASAEGAERLAYINIAKPAFSGDCWIMVQNFNLNAKGAVHDVKLAIGFVPKATTGVFNLTGPTNVPALAPFEIRIDYKLDKFEDKLNDAWYGKLFLGSGPGKLDDVAEMEINIYKQPITAIQPLYLPLISK